MEVLSFLGILCSKEQLFIMLGIKSDLKGKGGYIRCDFEQDFALFGTRFGKPNKEF